MLCRPANSNIDPQIKYHNRHIDDIEHQRHQFQNKRSASIACPRNRLKIDIPRNYKNIGGTKDKQRRKRCRNKIGHIGVNAQNPIGTKDKKQYNRKHKQIENLLWVDIIFCPYFYKGVGLYRCKK